VFSWFSMLVYNYAPARIKKRKRERYKAAHRIATCYFLTTSLPIIQRRKKELSQWIVSINTYLALLNHDKIGRCYKTNMEIPDKNFLQNFFSQVMKKIYNPFKISIKTMQIFESRKRWLQKNWVTIYCVMGSVKIQRYIIQI